VASKKIADLKHILFFFSLGRNRRKVIANTPDEFDPNAGDDVKTIPKSRETQVAIARALKVW